MATISVPVKLSCWIETSTVWIPDLYPEPVLPILIELTVPEQPTIAVPPAEINGWYPNPSLDPTETIIPPRGRFEPFGSDVIDVAVPVKLIEEIPEASETVYS